ncbi:hypothetical protein [Kribbella kalugense]|uniref:Uncharacterized protein n=1 Tax=Kribbella kalugense TaxID=2512221 RepID=A0A4R8A1R5_9ACTN|nr:hypothetical protein [Kribbella kalugense]TDW24459.1 hypothetical protein EV650_3338 [Kribbella kalugense]
MSGRRSTASFTAGAVLLLSVAVPGVAHAGAAATSAACYVLPGSVTAGGAQTSQLITATSPPTARATTSYSDIYPDGQVRLSGTITNDPDITGTGGAFYGNVVMGSTMYASTYYLTEAGDVDRSKVYLTKVGGGWGDATFFDTTGYWKYPAPPEFITQYSLRSNGTITRWENGSMWANKQTATGFAAVKTMALISQTATYDTFLANTRGGALYTIRIPRTSPMKPIVKKVRDSTWQGFESLVIEKCGQYGTLLLGIDKDSRSGYLYAVGHANGTATVIKGLGKVPATFADPVYFNHVLRLGDAQMLFGE